MNIPIAIFVSLLCIRVYVKRYRTIILYVFIGSNRGFLCSSGHQRSCWDML